jgi:catechol 2,3-dioxygenase-like lactoylglutathione lyase family enzyme
LRRILFAIIIATRVLCAATDSEAATSVDAIELTVSDLDRSVEFYSKVLHFEKVAEFEVAGDAYEHLEGVFGLRMRKARLRLGDEAIELTEYVTPKGFRFPPNSHSNDLWFQHIAIIVSDMDRAYAWLRQNHVQHASPEPQRLPDWNQAAGGIQAFYFRDPDGHFLEILHFPPGKGKLKWHRGGAPLFLGIDHTAIVVRDTEGSLRFYRAILGLRIAGESENYGVEQERLNNVFAARVRITSLAADAGPGIELLEYLSPGDGRPYPTDEKPNDIVHWQTRYSGIPLAAAAAEFRRSKSVFISGGIVTLPDSEMGFRKSLVVRDPDGHAVQVIEH